MLKNVYPILFGLACALSPALALAQTNSGQQYSLLFQTGTYTPPANANAFRTTQALAASETAGGYYFRVVQFWQIPTEQEKKQIKSLGIQLHQYLPHNAYMASLPVNLAPEALTQLGVRALVKLEPAHKLSAALLSREYPEWAMRGADQIELVVQYFPSLAPETVEQLLSGQQVQVVSRYDFSNQLTVLVPVSQVEALAQMSFLSYVEPIDPPAEPENLVGRSSHRSNAIATDYAMGRQYNGLGVHVALGDDGIIGPHIDYQGRADQSTVSGNSGDHGDHVAGIIMGAGNRDPKARGMAFGADLHVYNVWDAIYSTPTSYPNIGIRITSLSYGNGCNAGYTSFARTVDQQIRQMPSLMHVFSAGNSGTTNCNYGAGNNWGNITGGVKAGKNVIAVANMTYTDGLSNSSSRGPAKDGRIKPDISAVGSSVYSTVDVNGYGTKSGTSMACPGVSGTLAQLYQAYRELNNGADPDAGLIKAIVLNTADDMGNAGPDFSYGFGRINALRAVRALEGQTFLTDTATQGSSTTHQIVVPAGTKELRAMVYWTDYEGASNAAIALVNDLNMQLTDPAATIYNPWVLNHAPVAATLAAPATRGFDNLNNVEQVTLDNPTPGTYTISVTGAVVPQGPQAYYVVYTMVTEAPELTYPIGGEALIPGTAETIRWDAYGDNGTFQLEYSADNGATWSNIATAAPATARYHNWTVPSTLITGQALVKISRGTFSDTSNAVFSVIKVPTGLSFEYICTDSLELKWNAVPGAIGYEISQLGQKYMDSVATTTATSVVLHGTDPTITDWFSVKAIAPDNGPGRRAMALQKPLGSVNCSNMNAAISAITSPVSGCFSGSNAQVCVTLQNPGASPITNMQLSMSVDNGTPVVMTVPGTLAVGATMNYCFTPTTINLMASGMVQIAVTVTVPGDLDPTNNQLTISPMLQVPPVAAISHNTSNMQFSFSTASVANATYSWTFGDGNTSTLQSPVHTYSAAGNYTVTLVVTDASGCSNTVTETVSVISGLSNTITSHLKLYPNPSAGMVTLEWDSQAGEQAIVEVSTIHGQLVKREIITGNQHQLSLKQLADGPYVVKLTNDRITTVARIVLQQ